MKNKDFKTYREGYLEGYQRGLDDFYYIKIKEKIFNDGMIIGILIGVSICILSLLILKLRGVI